MNHNSPTELNKLITKLEIIYVEAENCIQKAGLKQNKGDLIKYYARVKFHAGRALEFFKRQEFDK